MIDAANPITNPMNSKQLIRMLPMGSDIPEIVMRRCNSSNEDLHYEITADETGKIREICGEFGKDARTASKILLRTLLRLRVNPETALAAAKKFYLTANRLSDIPVSGFQDHVSG